MLQTAGPVRGAVRAQLGDTLGSMYTRHELVDQGVVTFNEDDGSTFVNMSKLTMLHTGALQQVGVAVQQELRGLSNSDQNSVLALLGGNPCRGGR